MSKSAIVTLPDAWSRHRSLLQVNAIAVDLDAGNHELTKEHSGSTQAWIDIRKLDE